VPTPEELAGGVLKAGPHDKKEKAAFEKPGKPRQRRKRKARQPGA
jgi:hypothetical protein